MTTGLIGMALAGIIVIVAIIKLGKFWLGWLISACTGLAALVVVNLTAAYTGVAIPYSLLSIALAGLGGIPGVVVMLVLRLIWPA